MESKYNTRKFSNRVRPKDDDMSSTQPQQADQPSNLADLDPTQEFTASSQATDTSSQPATQGYSSKYHLGHDQLSHPDERVRPDE
ncbi:hypothetical protein BDV38DRAFT_281502 [Aspergillus pseudotamarii]|uniref:Uncharacterized protein n=1 Tax=Aspergillus pseudotamarii TaxID=132259 RepID=A0A5N6SZS8_ASPPS|nr:uncharacterized protein BDV38DRAFT_281502 [Aspergillus pseudotamarii]KAE8138943.1 hypothetical protein BDV38DRAFT_281502 [Aspergillus pseudotamarii]